VLGAFTSLSEIWQEQKTRIWSLKQIPFGDANFIHQGVSGVPGYAVTQAGQN
jgi:hypothetical protein